MVYPAFFSTPTFSCSVDASKWALNIQSCSRPMIRLKLCAVASNAADARPNSRLALDLGEADYDCAVSMD
jgi:hypothetical protein